MKFNDVEIFGKIAEKSPFHVRSAENIYTSHIFCPIFVPKQGMRKWEDTVNIQLIFNSQLKRILLIL